MPEEPTINLNDPRCQQFIEAVAACMVHAAQGAAQPEDAAEEPGPSGNRQMPADSEQGHHVR